MDDIRQEFEACADLLNAIGDRQRQHIITKMLDESVSGSRVVEIAKLTNLSRPAASRHMQILRKAGIVTARKDGTRIRYYLNPDPEELHQLELLVQRVQEIMKTRVFEPEGEALDD